jgi:hypothetical protein
VDPIIKTKGKKRGEREDRRILKEKGKKNKGN